MENKASLNLFVYLFNFETGSYYVALTTVALHPKHWD